MSDLDIKKLLVGAGEELPLELASFKGALEALTQGRLPKNSAELELLLKRLPDHLHQIEAERWAPIPASELGTPLYRLVRGELNPAGLPRREETPYQLHSGYRLDLMDLLVTVALYAHRDCFDCGAGEDQFLYSLTGIIEHRAASYIESAEAEKVFMSVDRAATRRVVIAND